MNNVKINSKSLYLFFYIFLIFLKRILAVFLENINADPSYNKKKKKCQLKKKMLCTNRVALIRYNFNSKVDFF